MSELKKPIGKTGRAVADSIARLRIENGLTFNQLSEATAEAGRRITPLGLRRIFDYQQRIDIDDLVTLAEVLHTTPECLMDTSASEKYRKDCLRWLLAEAEHGGAR